MFTNKVPWVTSTPASRQIIKTAETPMNVPNKEAAMALQPPLFPALASTGESAAEPLTDHEMKMLSHLRGLKSMNITLTGDLGLQLEALENREKEVASNKALSHGHLNKYNKVKAQVSAQAKKISSLDAEWSNFVQTTLQKIMMHAEMYQRCRSDLLEVYNQKLEELRRMKAELKLASHSLLEEQHGEPEGARTIWPCRTSGSRAGSANSSRPCGTGGQSSGRRRRGGSGYEGQWRGAVCERSQIDREGAFQGGCLPAESGQSAPQNQEGEGEDQGGLMDYEGIVHRYSWEFSCIESFGKQHDPPCDVSAKPDMDRTGVPFSKELSHMTQVVTHFANAWRETIDHIFHHSFSWVGWCRDDRSQIQNSALTPLENFRQGRSECSTHDISHFADSGPIPQQQLDRDKVWESWWNTPFTWTIDRVGNVAISQFDQQQRGEEQYPKSILRNRRQEFEPHSFNDGAFMSLRNQKSRHETSRREVSFHDSVDIVSWHGDQEQQVSLGLDRAHDFLRNFWHLHGQIACWKTIQSAFHRLTDGQENEVPGPDSESDQAMPAVAVSHDNAIRTFGETDLANLISTQVNFEHRAPKFIETWYLSRERYHLCVRSRRIRIENNMRLEDLQERCRSTWSDICDATPLILVEVVGAPRGLPSSILHLLVLQGPIEHHNAVIFQSERLPVLFRQRAVIYPVESTVHHLLREVQFPDLCQHDRWSCFARWRQQDQWQIKNGHEVVEAPFAICLEGDARWDDSDPEEDGREPETDGVSTVAPSDSVAEDDEEFSFMSGGPIMWPFENLPGFQHHLEQEMEQNMDLVDEPNIVFAHHHLGHIQDHIAVIMEDLPQDQRSDRWAVVTFGIGLIDLGRRDTTFYPWRAHELLDAIYVLWEDHAQYGDLTVFNVHPQPMDIAGEKSIVVIVEVHMPEAHNVMTRNVLVHERAVQGVVVRPSHYAAKVEDGSGVGEILSQLNLHHLCPPFTLRECGIRMGMQSLQQDHHYSLDHGLYCLVWIGSRPQEVERAILQVTGAEAFFLQCQRLAGFQPDRMTISFTVHGISPAGRPLGHRMLHCDVAELQNLHWISSMQQLWPFHEQGMRVIFVEERT